ncbi:hypothetical protein E2C01_024746 [Portunus trituberculatus]|uniref:Uncharacterized protein n=1 Tax=Portunus trituberculatus TaxID=210409 RepID=A0A5B7EDQ8_PORTR|nr:hypothetical protein [Portunus trituberculatus]
MKKKKAPFSCQSLKGPIETPSRDSFRTLLGELSKERPLTCTWKPPWNTLHWEQPERAEQVPVSKLTKVTSEILKRYCLGAMMPLASSLQDPELRAECPTTRELKIPAGHNGKPVPVAKVSAARCCVVTEYVVGVHHLADEQKGGLVKWNEGGRRHIHIEQGRGGPGEHCKVVFHHVVLLHTVLREDSVTHVVVSHVALHHQIIRPVDCHRAVVGAVNGTTTNPHLACLSDLHILNMASHQVLVGVLAKQHHRGTKLVTANLVTKPTVKAGLGVKLVCVVRERG